MIVLADGRQRLRIILFFEALRLTNVGQDSKRSQNGQKMGGSKKPQNHRWKTTFVPVFLQH